VLYKQHIDYIQIYPSFISIVLTLKEIILKCLLKCESCTHHCEIIYIRDYILYIYILYISAVKSINRI